MREWISGGRIYKEESNTSPIGLGIIFSMVYHRLPLNYFAIILLGGLIGIVLILYDIRIGIYAGVFIFPFMPDMLNLLFMILWLEYIYVRRYLRNQIL